MAHIIALQFKEGFLSQDTTAISGQVPISSDHSVARYDNADRIMTDSTTNCLSGHPFEPALFCQFVGNPTVCNRLPIRNLAHNLSDTISEIGTHQMDLREKARIAA